MNFFRETHINFVGKRHFFFLVSVVSLVVVVIGAVIFPPILGIDFTGGTEIAADFKKPIETAEIRKVFKENGYSGSEIKSFGEDNQFLIRIQETGKANEIVDNILRTQFSNYKVEILKIDQIGPKIGKELGLQALLAVILAVIAILLYIAFRFEFVFGLGAVIALVHDVIFTFLFVVIFNHFGLIELELNQSMVAAILTVIGYSINDTVIVFDRIRENREKFKGFDFIKMVNLSVNETLSRTINTVLTVVLVLVTLTLLGGPVLEGFAFTMFIGIIAGTYSSIYVASSFVIWYMQKIKKIELKEFSGYDEIVANPTKA